MKYVEVILPLPLEGTFTYGVPDTLLEKVVPGVRLLVPFGKIKTYIGICSAAPTDQPCKGDTDGVVEYKSILSVLDDTPVLFPQQLRLWHWIANTLALLNVALVVNSWLTSNKVKVTTAD